MAALSGDFDGAREAPPRSSPLRDATVGTCTMGVDDVAAVDLELRVHGLEGLRVCDSSIMPHLVSSNTNAATLTTGEKAADRVRGMLQQEAMAPKELHAAT